ncbi:MAG TPA: cytochrome c [Vicinamibacterales bacterium]|nr:cytochrome c [Vicinamibacterales bacterium]
MATARSRFTIAAAVLAGLIAARALHAQSPAFGVGHAPSPEQLKQIDIDVTPDGKGLVPGRGTAATGKDVYTRRCETCHGPTGKEGPQEALSGGKGSLATPKPQKSVGSYWPYATTLWDYINRAMPFDHPSTLTPDEVYSATAYVLFLNGIVGEQDVLDEKTLPKVQMPNRNGFVADPRPDVPLKRK